MVSTSLSSSSFSPNSLSDSEPGFFCCTIFSLSFNTSLRNSYHRIYLPSTPLRQCRFFGVMLSPIFDLLNLSTTNSIRCSPFILFCLAFRRNQVGFFVSVPLMFVVFRFHISIIDISSSYPMPCKPPSFLFVLRCFSNCSVIQIFLCCLLVMVVQPLPPVLRAVGIIYRIYKLGSATRRLSRRYSLGFSYSTLMGTRFVLWV